MPIRYRYISVTAASSAVLFVKFCSWPAAILSAVYLVLHHSYLSGILALAWPAGLSGVITVPGQTGRIELMLAQKVGYIE